MAVSIYIPTNRSIALYSLQSPCIHCLLLRSQGNSASSMAKQVNKQNKQERKVCVLGVRLSGYGTCAEWSCSTWNPPGPGIEATPPALAGEFLTTGPARKSRKAPFPLCRASVCSCNHFRTVPPDAIATYYTWSFRFKWIKIKLNLNFSSSVSLATYQVLSCHM